MHPGFYCHARLHRSGYGIPPQPSSKGSWLVDRKRRCSRAKIIRQVRLGLFKIRANSINPGARHRGNGRGKIVKALFGQIVREVVVLAGVVRPSRNLQSGVLEITFRKFYPGFYRIDGRRVRRLSYLRLHRRTSDDRERHSLQRSLHRNRQSSNDRTIGCVQHGHPGVDGGNLPHNRGWNSRHAAAADVSWHVTRMRRRAAVAPW